MGGVDRLPIGKKGDVGKGPFALELLAEDVDGLADLFQAHAGIEQALDHLELDDISEGIQPLRTRPFGVLERRLDQIGPGPIIQLAVGDPDQAANQGCPITLRDWASGNLGGHSSSSRLQGRNSAVVSQASDGLLAMSTTPVENPLRKVFHRGRLAGLTPGLRFDPVLGSPGLRVYSSPGKKSSMVTSSSISRKRSISSSSDSSENSIPASARTCEETNTWAPARTASAIASEGRVET